MHRSDPRERLGAHVSVQGGVETAPVRGKLIGATAIQVFTKTPSQWREPGISSQSYDAFRRECERCNVSTIVGHDSYLINLASPDPALSARSEAAFVAELQRCKAFGIPYLVSHPGNYIDDRDAGLVRNAAAYTRCLRVVPESPIVLLETTAGCGTALGSTFQELALLRAAIADDVRPRIAFCADTCHLYSAGHDLVGDYDGVWLAWDEILGLDNLLCLHLNDSKTKFASRRDRHELIGEGSLGPQPFRRIMTDPRLAHVIKILETPKGDDGVTADRKMLRRLRRYARAVRAPR
ncbi:MAG: deoxyribonuclease [Gemmatimonadales bacterium]|nr:deoxyribonuclease [Gemmatimonadales bacterium]